MDLYNKKLILKYLLKETTNNETKFVEKLISENLFYKSHYDNVYKFLNSKNYKTINVNLAWKKFELNRDKKKVVKRTILIYKRAIAIALIIISVGFGYILNSDASDLREIYVARAERSSFSLEDGTKIWINSDSKIKILPNFNNGVRGVYLEGEAYFDVAKNSKVPFIVKTKYLKIIVHGTKFNVSDYKNDNVAEVKLDEGTVSVNSVYDKDKVINITSGTRVKICKSKPKCLIKSKFKLSGNKTVWVNNILRFKNETFKSVKNKMERWYNVQIVIKDECLNNEMLTMKITDESFEKTLKYIKKVIPFKYEIKGGKYILYKCNDHKSYKIN